jgi:hypothetical protein
VIFLNLNLLLLLFAVFGTLTPTLSRKRERGSFVLKSLKILLKDLNSSCPLYRLRERVGVRVSRMADTIILRF